MEDGVTDHYASEGVAYRCRRLQGVVGHLESSDVSSKAMISTFSIVILSIYTPVFFSVSLTCHS